MSDDEEKVDLVDLEEKKPTPLLPSEDNYNHIKNKQVRLQHVHKLKREKRKLKKAERQKRQKEGLPKGIPHTIESLREKDVTTIGDLDAEENLEIAKDLEQDELADYYRNEYEPKVLITYSDNPLRKTRIFGRELTRVIPNSVSLYRNRSGVKKMVQSAIKKNFTDILVINEHQKEPDGLLVSSIINLGP